MNLRDSNEALHVGHSNLDASRLVDVGFTGTRFHDVNLKQQVDGYDMSPQTFHACGDW